MASSRRGLALAAGLGAALAAGCPADDNGAPTDPDGATTDEDAATSGPDADEAEGAWSEAAPVGGGPVQEFGAAVLEGELYVVGGMLESGEILADVQVYDPAEDAWDEVAALPAPTHHPNVAAHDGSLYVVGSLEGLGFSARGAVWRWAPGEEVWEDVSQMPSPRGAAAVDVIDGAIYVAGGYDGGGAVTAFSAYDPAADAWTTDLPDLPEPRDHLVGAAVSGVFYALGGRNAGIADLSGRVDAFDPTEGVWEARAEMITPRAGGAGDAVGGEIVVVGGEGNREPGAPRVFAEAEAYDPETDSWRALADMPTPRHGMFGAGIGGALYVPGGATEEGLNGTTAIHEVITP